MSKDKPIPAGNKGNDSEKRTFLMMAGEIGNMGGGQMFIANKCQFYESKGWRVELMYYTYHKKIGIKYLEKYRDNWFPFLIFNPLRFSKKEREKCLDYIIDKLHLTSDTVIESEFFPHFYWCELLAQRLKCRHICNPLNEYPPYPTDRLATFWEFKLKRGEWLNASEYFLRRYFGFQYKEEYSKYFYTMEPYCSNVSADVEPEIEFRKADFTIMSVGRLNKDYILPAFRDIRSFVSKHPDKTFNLIVIGGSTKGNKEGMVDEIFENVPNIKVYQLGYIMPIPYAYIDNSDVAIATSNSILVTSDRGIPTIAVDVDDFKAMGVYPYTTTHRIFRDGEPQIEIETLLNDILFEKKFTKVPASDVKDDKLEKAFTPQLEFVEKASSPLEYFDVVQTLPFSQRLKIKTKRLIKVFLGKEPRDIVKLDYTPMKKKTKIHK